MKNGHRRVLKRALTSRGIYLAVVLNLCFVASTVGQAPSGGHGVASCVAPPDGAFFVCYFPPPPPWWKVAGVAVNAPALLASVVLSETLEEACPRLCGLMTFFNLLTLAAGVWLQWTAASLAIGSLIEAARVKSRRA